MLYRLAAVVCFLLGGLRFLGITKELAAKAWKGAAIDVVIVSLRFGLSAFLWKLHRKMME